MILDRPWLAEIILFLDKGPANFNRIMVGINLNDPTLHRKLMLLAELGLVVRTVDVGPPIRSTYELTEQGRRFVGPFRDWRTEEVKWQSARIAQGPPQ